MKAWAILVAFGLVGCGSDSIDATSTDDGAAGTTNRFVVGTEDPGVAGSPSIALGSNVAGSAGFAATDEETDLGSNVAGAAGSAAEAPKTLIVQVSVGGSPSTPTTTVSGGSSEIPSGTGGVTIVTPGRAAGGSSAVELPSGRAGNPNIVLVGSTPALNIGAGGADTTPRVQCCWYSTGTGRVEQATMTEAQCRALPNPWPCGLKV